MATTFGADTSHGTALAPVDRLRRALLAAVEPVAARSVPIARARGRVAASDVVAAEPVPTRDLATIDGWAVAAVETVGASPYAPAFVTEVRPVTAGAALPPGCDAVVASVGARTEAGLLMVESAVAPGDGVRPVGFDLRAGAVPARGGEALDGLALFALEAAGIEWIEVRVPRVTVSGTNAGAARFVAGEVEARGAEIGADGEIEVVIAGPVVAFDHEAVAELRARGEVLARGIALGGAETAVAGRIDGRVRLVMPDRPEAVFAVTRALILPLIDALAGATRAEARETRALARKLVSRVGLHQSALVEVDAGGCWRPLATGDLTLAALARAEAVIDLAPESEGLAEGTAVAATLLRNRSNGGCVS